MNRKILYTFLGLSLMLALFVKPGATEAAYTIKEMTPEVQSALESRRDRFDQLKGLKANGILGENNSGYVEVLVAGDEAFELAQAENQDRKTIYQTIADQNNLKDQIATIEKVFAEVQRDKAQAGEKVQNADGSWATK